MVHGFTHITTFNESSEIHPGGQSTLTIWHDRVSGSGSSCCADCWGCCEDPGICCMEWASVGGHQHLWFYTQKVVNDHQKEQVVFTSSWLMAAARTNTSVRAIGGWMGFHLMVAFARPKGGQSVLLGSCMYQAVVYAPSIIVWHSRSVSLEPLMLWPLSFPIEVSLIF